VDSEEADVWGYEESLTEDQLLARIDLAQCWQSRAGKLSATSEQAIATPAQVATREQLFEYSCHVERLSDMILRVRLDDRFASPTAEQMEELREWASAPPASYECRKLWKRSGVISRNQALETIRKIRRELKSKHAVYCTAARAFKIAAEDEFFPGYGTLLFRPDQPKKNRARASLKQTTPFRRWIAEILVRIGTDASALEVAKQIEVSDPRVEDQYRGDGTNQLMKNPLVRLDKILLADRALKKHFETLVSDVRGLVTPKGNWS